MTPERAQALAGQIAKVNALLYGGTHPELLDAAAALTDAADAIVRLRADVKHWQSNHNVLVEKNAFLSQRPDLPVDRIPAYAALVHAREFVRIQEGRIDVMTDLLRTTRNTLDFACGALGVSPEPAATLRTRLSAVIGVHQEQAQVLARQTDWK